MRIKQAYVGVSYFREAFLRKWDLVHYNHLREPAVFFGIYRNQRLKLIQHRSLAIAVWAGSDASQIKYHFAKQLKEHPNIQHIAISSFISEDLKKFDIPHRVLPITPEDFSIYKPVPLGDAIYMYIPKKKQKFYGIDTYDAIRKELPDVRIIKADIGDYNKQQLQKAYAQCFMGIRPTPHDGMSNTVIELGMMGRKCIWNGDAPNAIHFSNEKSIIRAIREERKKIGTTDRSLSRKMSSFVDIGDEWLNVDFEAVRTRKRKTHPVRHEKPKRVPGKKHRPVKRSFLMSQIEQINQYDGPPIVSVIMNTYKEDEKILRQAIESYLKQKGVCLQLIISTVKDDPSVAIAKSYKGVEVHENPEPGIYQQLNNAIELVQGDWFAYASGNDIAKPDKLYNEVVACRKNRKLIAYSDYVIVDHNLKMIKKRMFGPYDPDKHLRGNFVNDCALMHRSILDRFKPFNWQKWGNHAYYDFWLRVYHQIGDVFAYNQSYEWFYRMSPTSSHVVRAQDTKKKMANKKLRDDLILFHKRLRKI